MSEIKDKGAEIPKDKENEIIQSIKTAIDEARQNKVNAKKKITL